MARRSSGGSTPYSDVNAAARARNALRMRQLGYTYERIAEQCGYHDRSVAYNAVQRVLKRDIGPLAEDVRGLELSRLDQLLTVYFAKAMKGEDRALHGVLRIMERRSAFLGLDAAHRKGDDENAGLPTIVREAYPASWIDGLTVLAAAQPSAPAPAPAESEAPA